MQPLSQKKLALLLIPATGLIGGFAIYQSQKNIETKLKENVSSAEYCVKFHSSDRDKFRRFTKVCDKVNQDALPDRLKASFLLALKRNDSGKSAEEAEQESRRKKAEFEAKKLQDVIAREREEADSAFKSAGWWEASRGIYARYCTSGPDPCSSGGVIGSARYVLIEVWCKERACGDIYGRVNLLAPNGTVVGWTNDSGYGDYGQKVVLTFNSYQKGWDKAQVTELSFR